MNIDFKRNYGKGVYNYNYCWVNIDKILKVIDDYDDLKTYLLSVIYKKTRKKEEKKQK